MGYISVGLYTKIMFLLKVAAMLWPTFNSCKYYSPVKLWGPDAHENIKQLRKIRGHILA